MPVAATGVTETVISAVWPYVIGGALMVAPVVMTVENRATKSEKFLVVPEIVPSILGACQQGGIAPGALHMFCRLFEVTKAPLL